MATTKKADPKEVKATAERIFLHLLRSRAHNDEPKKLTALVAESYALANTFHAYEPG